MATQLQRMQFIDSRIRQGKAYSAKSIANEYEVSERSIKRDIDEMKNSFNAPIKYSKIKGYYYGEKFEIFNFLGEKSLIASAMMKKILESLNYIPLTADNIISNLDESVGSELKFISDKIRYDFSEYEEVDIALFKVVIDSMNYKKQLKAIYNNADGVKSERVLEPLRLMNYSGKWYLVAYCVMKNIPKIFLFSRFEKLVLTDVPNVYECDDLKLNNLLSNSFGLDLEENPKEAVIRFYQPVSDSIKNQKWHKNQKIRNGKNNIGEFIEFIIPVGRYREILGRILRFGMHAEVVEPEDLRNKWLENIKMMYDRYIKQ
ncbi:MAG: WYL domain-containing protein [Candidatus Delongbacteria bacterium]|nr:WYL domain-containing protein [Candidatus Delongbacteria bacterium]MBN2835740.1 WYL domain-containing protein [Candidatus Delongbacteria bacterium]